MTPRHHTSQPRRTGVSYSWVSLLFLLVLAGAGPLRAQTDFAPGEIMFTGYDSDDPDAFSIVLLTDVLSGTVIYITDRGWSNTTGFRVDNTGEGTISLTFNQNYPCGTSIVFTDIGGAIDWEAKDGNGNIVGTIAIDPAGDPDGIEFNAVTFPPADGDQLFIYQMPAPVPNNQSSFITGIHMNGGPWNGGNGDDYSSQKPNGLADNQVVRFVTEVDNAKYNCAPAFQNPEVMQAEITNDNGFGGLIEDAYNGWTENNNYINLNPTCDFCCPALTLPTLDYPAQVAPNSTFTVTLVGGTLPPGGVWELRTAGCNTGSPITTSGNTFTLTAPASEQTLTYYLQNSLESNCPDDCISFTICVESNPLAPCTVCNANILACGDCFLPPPDDNPDLDAGCYELKLIFVLDESGSMGPYETQVRDGVLAFLNALNGQDILCALIEFSGTAAVVNDYTLINNSYIQAVTTYFNGTAAGNQAYQPNGATNWHDAMIKADNLLPSDLLLVVTDGEPTAWDVNGNLCGDGTITHTPEIVNPVKLANKLKGEGTHMFMLGVGGGIDYPNLIAMSGPIAYQSGVNTIGDADYSIGDFASLANDLVEFVEDLCATPFSLTKEIVGPACDSFVQFRFIAHNLGTESAATGIQVFDSLPSGYLFDTILYPPPPRKFCIGDGCIPQGQGQPPNAFIWSINSIPPGESDTLLISVQVLPNGNYTNIAWAQGINVALTSDTVLNPVINDDLPPIITCPGNVAIECDESPLPANTGSATASDNSTYPIDITYSDVTTAGDCEHEYTIMRTWTATDACNNTDDCVQVIQVTDTTPPDLDCPPNVTLDCGSDTDPATAGMPIVTDNCSTDIIPTHTDMVVAGGCPAEMVIQRTWTAMDLCGNVSTCTQVITIVDDTSPDLTCPPDLTLACTESTEPAETGLATATDNCSTVTVTHSDEVQGGTCTEEYIIVRTWTATDACGNVSTCEQTIDVVDDLAPAITCPANLTIECTQGTQPAQTGSVTATDACDPDPAIAHADVTIAGSCPQAYTINRTWTVTDGCGNSTTCLQVITIVDTTPPVLACAPDMTIECDESTLPAHAGETTATDNCSTPDIGYSDMIIPSGGAAPQLPAPSMRWVMLPGGSTTGSCTSGTDCEADVICFGLEYIPSVTGTMTSYTTAFFVDCPGGSSPVLSNASCVMTNTSSASPCIAGGFLLLNSSGNTGNVAITAGVPVILHQLCLSMPAGSAITLEEDAFTDLTASIDLSGGGAFTEHPDYATYTADRDILCDPGPVCPQNYTIMRTWTGTDDCSNSASCTQVITVLDQTAPVLTCPADLTLECTADTTPDSTGMATATDNCDLSPAIGYADVTTEGTCVGEWTITRTWTATDTCGNAHSCTQVLSIVDTTAPMITCPADVTITCLEDTTPDSTGIATATDNCDPDAGVVHSDNVLNPPGDPGYTIERTWTATDECGNSNTCLQLITVTNPLMADTLPYDTICSGESVTFETTDPGYPGMTFNWSFGSGSSPGSGTDIGPHTVTYTYNATNGTTGAWVLLTLQADGCEAVTDTVSNVNVNVIPVAGIVTSAGTPCIFGAKTFQPSTTEVPGYSYLWNFGAGAVPATAATYGPHTVEYSTAGSKTVQLIIHSNEAGASCSDTATTTFTVNTCPGNITGNVNLVTGAPLSAVVHQLFADNDLDGQPDNTTVIKQGISTSTGTWVMSNVTPGHYVIKQVQPAAYYSVLDEDTSEDQDSVLNLDQNDNIIPVTMEPNELDANNRFWEAASPGIISGYVFDDADNNQSPGASEGIAGVTVELFADDNQDGQPDSGTPLATTLTSALGYYTFGNLTTGHFVVEETQPAGYNNILDIDVSADGDAVPNTNQMDDIIPVTITAAEHDAGNYFIEQSPCSKIVTNLVDGDPGSLRYMIDCADSGDTIIFHASLAGDTVPINLGRIQFSKTLFIHSGLTPAVVIKSNVNGMFKVNAGHGAEFKNLVIISGLSGFPGAAFENLGNLTLYDILLRPNSLLVPLENLIVNSPSATLIFRGDVQILQE